MIVTLNEVQRTCQKAMSGAGAPAGVDDDAAMAAAWLEGRGLPALGGSCWSGMGVPASFSRFERKRPMVEARSPSAMPVMLISTLFSSSSRS
ncbi:MAG: DUF3726 domain-containing protein [Proteobacteria bacterium]|nr:DUF3726 domain-containing protein [Pseudomonadota bacterium]